MSRAATILVLVAAVVLIAAAPSSADAASSPRATATASDSCGAGCTCPGICADAILGQWNDDGGIIQFSGGGGTYHGFMVQANQDTCGYRDPNIRITGSGAGRYSGKVAYYRTDDNSCSPVGDGTIQINVAPGSLTAAWHTSPPPQFSCCNGSGSYSRPGTAAPGFDYINRAREAFTNPCDIESATTIAGGGGDVDGCGRIAPSRVVAAKGAGGLVCAVATALSFAQRLTGFTVPKQVKECIESNQRLARGAAPGSASRVVASRAVRGKYKGFTTPVGHPGSDPTNQQLAKAATKAARSAVRGGHPPGAQKVSLSVGKGKAITLNQKVQLRCADGTPFAYKIEGMPLGNGKKFSDSAEDVFAASALQGKFAKARVHGKRRAIAVGALYVSISEISHGPCSSFVTFAARGPKAH